MSKLIEFNGFANDPIWIASGQIMGVAKHRLHTDEQPLTLIFMANGDEWVLREDVSDICFKYDKAEGNHAWQSVR